jgi:HlyD family secretion protein
MLSRLKKKRWVIIIAIIVIAVGVYFLRPSGAGKAETAPQLSQVKVEEGPIRLAVDSTGRVVPNLNVDIKCKASGEVITLPYDISDTVTQGALLVELDPIDEERNVEQAKVELTASQAKLAQAQLNLDIAERTLATEKGKADAALKSAEAQARDAQAKADRMKQLLGKKLASQEDYGTAETAAIQAASDLENARVHMDELKTQEISLGTKREDVRLAQSQVESDKINLEIAQQRLKDTKVFAPMDGVVTARNVQRGQIISSGISNVGGGTTVLTLSDLSHVYVLASVDESDIGKVALGQPAIITADAFPNLTFRGKVVRIATMGVNNSNVVTFEVKIEVLSRDKRLLKPEMTANVEIVAAEKENALLIPAEAVSRQRGKTFVEVVKNDGTTEKRQIEVGISDGVSEEVLKGLSLGETVMVNKGEVESRWRSQNGGQQRPRNIPVTRVITAAGRRGGR